MHRTHRTLALVVGLVTVAAPATAQAALRPTPAPTGTAVATSGGEQLVRRSARTTPDGVTHTRYDRTVDGMRVVGGDIVVHSKNGTVQRTTWGRGRTVALADKTPKVTAVAAQKAARGRLEAGTRATTTSELVVFASENGPRLAHEVVATGIRPDQTPTRLHVVVDALTGAVLETADEVQHEGTGTGVLVGQVGIDTSPTSGGYTLSDGLGHVTRDLQGATSGSGVSFVDADDVWGDGTTSNRQSAAVDAHFGAQKTYDFFLTSYGRRGIWDTGRGAPSRVHYGSGYQNAFWDGSQMTYGDGAGNARPLTSLDVAAHEMTHGITQNTANLSYSGESGGLNEASSDIFGTMVERYANVAADSPDYLVGEKINIYGNGAPLRYMDRPSKDGRSADCWTRKVGQLDVHYSSGPLNHWFYLASEGSGAKTINGVGYNSPTCNGRPVTGVGADAVAKIWYNTLAHELTSRATYKDARDGALRQAKALYGRNSAQCVAVQSAFDGIAVPKGTQTCST